MFWAVGDDGPAKRRLRGVAKGYKASKMRKANGSGKLNVAFSAKLGGVVGMNNRSFTDDVVVIMKRKMPIIGVRRWSDVHPDIHRQIVTDVLVSTTFHTFVCLILSSIMQY